MSLEKALGEAVAGIVESKLKKEKRNTYSMYEALRDGRKKGVKVITELKPSSPSIHSLKDRSAAQTNDYGI